MFGSNPFGQSSSSPFGSQSVFGQTTNASSNPFASKPFGNANPFGTQSGGSMFGGTSTGVFGSQSSASTSVFGASSSPAFGNAPAFGASSGSSPFGQKPAFGGFGSSTTQTSPFGSSFQQSQPAFGSNLFGSSTPFGTQSQPGFGASSSPAFGAASTPAFGGTSTGVFGQTASPTFGSTSGGFGLSSPFGLNTPAFGTSSSSAFGATTAPSFGATLTPVFGATPTPAFGATPTPAFGSSPAPAFGATPAPAFGSSSTAFNFGSSPAFGQSTSAFGSSPFGTTSSFGAQSAAFGTLPTTPTFGQQPAFGVQRGGSRVSPYLPTPETDGAAGTQPGKLESISAMPVYKDKSHEELRWEDYQLGDKGGPTTAGQSTAVGGFGISGIGSTATPSFGQASANPFSSSISPNPFAPKIPGFSSPAFGSSSAFSPSPFGQTNISNPFGSTSSATSSLFGPTTQSFGVNTTSPSLFSSSATSAFGPPSIFGTSAQGTTSAFSTGLGFGNSQSSTLFQSTTPAFSQTSSPFAQTSSAFGQTASGFGQSNLFSTPSSGFSGNLFSSSSSLLSNINPLGFGQASPFSTPFQPVQPAQNIGGFNFGNSGQSQAGGTGGFTGNPVIFGQSSFGQQPAPQNIMAAQAPPITNPFGTLPAMPQMSIGGPGSSIQYGISSLPVVEKPMPARLSSFLTSRHLSQRCGRMPIRRYHPNADGAKVPFFSGNDEIQSTPKADAFYVPRENPRSLVIRPLEQWPSRSSVEKTTPLRFNPVHVNAALGEESKEHEHVNEQVNNPVEGNQKAANGVHDPNKEISLTSHRANEAAIVYEHGADIEALMPKLRHSDYFTKPRIQEIAAKERSNPGFSRHVKDFVVGRHGYGSIKFFGETDVRRLDLESLVQFNNREVIVYMDETKKPHIGQGLNKPADVTLLNIKVFDKKSGEQITEGSRIEKYKAMLKRKAEDQGAEFVSYDPIRGEWKFRVDHFSRYKLGDEGDESDNGDL